MKKSIVSLFAAGPTAAWDVMIAFIATAAAILVPAHVVAGTALVPRFATYDAVLTLLFLADLALRWGPAGEEAGFRRTTLRAADLLSALPLELVTGFTPLSLLRLLKLVRVAGILGRWRYDNLHLWNLLRLVYFVYWLVLGVHWLSCGWFTLRDIPAAEDPLALYVKALHVTVSLVSTIGYADNYPGSTAERLYAIMAMITGVGTYGYVIGSAATILANIDPSRAGYSERMEKLSGFMNYRGIPLELQRRVRDYHRYVWEHRLGYDEAELVGGLPPSLKSEVVLYLKREVIQNVPMFARVGEELLTEIALAMRPVVFMSGDTVFHEGDHGRAMYFISIGRVEVLARDGSTLAVLGKGDAFGEMALVLDRPRNATVRAMTYCDLYQLDKGIFDEILARHPEFSQYLQELVDKRDADNRAREREVIIPGHPLRTEDRSDAPR
jgi:voltage-gated potassium channel